MVPMVFVYSPAMLIVLDDYFTWGAFLETTITCAIGIIMVATAISAYFIAHMPTLYRFLMGMAGILMVAPGTTSDLYSIALLLPVLIQQVSAYRKQELELASEAA